MSARRLRRFAATSLLVISAMGIGATTSHAAPAPEQSVSNIDYTAHRDGDTAVVSIDAGAFRLDGTDGAIDIVDDSGELVATVPTFFRIDDVQHPLAAALDDSGRVLRLTPNMDPAAATPVPVAEQFAPSDIAAPETVQERDREALNNFQRQLGVTTAVTAIVAAIVGGGIGCAIGLIPATAGLVVPFLGLAIPIAGCIGGALMVAPVAALAGTIFVGGGALVVLGIQYFQTINTPFVPPVPAA